MFQQTLSLAFFSSFFLSPVNSVEGFLLLPLTGFCLENNYEFRDFQELHSSSSTINAAFEENNISGVRAALSSGLGVRGH